MKYFAVCTLLILPLVSGGVLPRPPTRHFVAYEIQSTHNLPQMEAIVQKMQTLLQNMIPDMSVLADSVAVPDMSVATDAADETPRSPSTDFKIAPIASLGLKQPLLDMIAGAIASMDADLIPDMSVASYGDDTPKQVVSGIKTLPKMTKVSGGEPVEIMTHADADLIPDMSVASDADDTPRKVAAGLKTLPQLTKVSGGEPVEIMTHADADLIPDISVASDADVTPKQAVAGLKTLPQLTKVSGADPVEPNALANADLVPDMSVASDAEDKAANQLPDISVAGDAKFDPKMTLAALLARLH